jgi:hypothetical protein
VSDPRIQDEALEILYQDARVGEVYYPGLALAVNRKVLQEHVGVVHANFCAGEIDYSLSYGVLEDLLKY